MTPSAPHARLRRGGRALVATVAAAVAPAALALAVGPGAAPALADDPPGQFTVTGAGYGHGVGLSQWGAYGMARAGFDAAAIVTHYYSGTTVAPVQDDMDIRVSLLHQVPGVKFRSEPLDPTGGAIEVTVNGTVTVGSATGGPTLLDLAGIKGSLASPGHRYRYGFLEVLPTSTSSGTRLNAVNSVRIHDEYLYGISEVSSAWPMAALQAQILAARTYAISKVVRGVRQACACHLDDGGGPYFDQTFTGYAKQSAAKGDQWIAAVNGTAASDTTGLAILYKGAPISAFYSASSGGFTRSSKEVWGTDLPYAQSVPDPYINQPENSVRSWTVNVPQAAMASAFGIPAVAHVNVTERYASGAPRVIVATAPDGSTSSRSGGALQSALGLKSTYITAIDGNPGVPLPTVDPAAAPAAPGTPPAAPAPDPAASATPAPAAPTPAPDPVVTNNVRQRTVSLLTGTSVAASTPHYRVAGVVRPAKAGLAVWRQRQVKGTWKTVDRTVTNAKGHYAFRVKAKGSPPGAYRILVVKKGVVVGVSAQITVG